MPGEKLKDGQRMPACARCGGAGPMVAAQLDGDGDPCGVLCGECVDGPARLAKMSPEEMETRMFRSEPKTVHGLLLPDGRMVEVDAGDRIEITTATTAPGATFRLMVNGRVIEPAETIDDALKSLRCVDCDRSLVSLVYHTRPRGVVCASCEAANCIDCGAREPKHFVPDRDRKRCCACVSASVRIPGFTCTHLAKPISDAEVIARYGAIAAAMNDIPEQTHLSPLALGEPPKHTCPRCHLTVRSTDPHLCSAKPGWVAAIDTRDDPRQPGETFIDAAKRLRLERDASQRRLRDVELIIGSRESLKGMPLYDAISALLNEADQPSQVELRSWRDQRNDAIRARDAAQAKLRAMRAAEALREKESRLNNDGVVRLSDLPCNAGVVVDEYIGRNIKVDGRERTISIADPTSQAEWSRPPGLVGGPAPMSPIGRYSRLRGSSTEHGSITPGAPGHEPAILDVQGVLHPRHVEVGLQAQDEDGDGI